ncbi:hypothetical protein KGP25_15730 [Enterobacter sp. JBIWA003]|uniref:hypothetical protein n=1 Tax=Enterobacter sp. JBIWA003 TaxID=2831890 RepID=UPI001CBC7F42|nr:hypothetical protein [Enterobacter sp. JBIWA003]UAN20624.1 hypothetical protein KGP25_15730 [Enterobacter sp. JBIWA003]
MMDDANEAVKEWFAKIVGAGSPVLAIASLGAVEGLSAAGITSGLAALGLGFGMVGGVVAVGVIGYGAYHGAKWVADQVEDLIK